MVYPVLRGSSGVRLLEDPRQVTSEWHILQAKRWLDFDAGRQLDSVLVYAAVELRLAIERTLFELLYLLKERQIADEDVKRARSLNGLQALLRETDAFYRRTIEFTHLVASVTAELPAVSAIDTAYLNRKWSELSEYCHLQFKPAEAFQSPDREFQRRGFALLQELLDRFLELRVKGSMGVLQRSSMPEETRFIYDKFVAGKIDADQAKRMLVISGPVLGQRPEPGS